MTQVFSACWPNSWHCNGIFIYFSHNLTPVVSATWPLLTLTDLPSILYPGLITERSNSLHAVVNISINNTMQLIYLFPAIINDLFNMHIPSGPPEGVDAWGGLLIFINLLPRVVVFVSSLRNAIISRYNVRANL